MAKTSMTTGRALIFIPGTLFWPLILGGILTHDNRLIGIALALFLVTMIVAIAVKARSSSAEKAERLRIWTQGRPASAKVVTLGTKGGGLNGHPKVDFELEVDLPGHLPYAANISALISMLAIPRVQPGCRIDVRVDPEEKTRLVVDPSLTPYGYE